MSIEFDVTQRFAAPPERVFHALTDLDAAREWMQGFVRLERVGEVASGPGMRFRETRRMYGRDATEEFEVTTYDPPRALGLYIDGSKGSSKRGEYRFDYRLEPDGDGTVVHMHGSMTGMPKVLGWLGKLLAGPFKKACARDLSALAAYLERTAPAAV
ncbi:MAG TPA: SRPBCC family protein [Longimicrobium sp.]|nr:SRPBCC family protein [Longimicrobium sp.]